MDREFKHRQIKFSDGTEAVVRDMDQVHIFVQKDDSDATEVTKISDTDFHNWKPKQPSPKPIKKNQT